MSYSCILNWLYICINNKYFDTPPTRTRPNISLHSCDDDVTTTQAKQQEARDKKARAEREIGRMLAQDIAQREARRKAEHGTFVEPSAAKEAAEQKKLQVIIERHNTTYYDITHPYHAIPYHTTNRAEYNSTYDETSMKSLSYNTNLYLPTTLPLNTGSGRVPRKPASQQSEAKKGTAPSESHFHTDDTFNQQHK